MKALLELNTQDLSLESIGTWPVAAKAMLVVFVFGLVLGFGYWVDLRKQLQRLDQAHAREIELKQEFENKQYKASNLQAYKQQLMDMKRSFGDMLRQLPSETEVPGLLEDVSKAGTASGLEFVLFAPQPEIQHDFYAELPIRIAVLGSYEQFANFVSRVGQLERIVTLHDFKIERVQPDSAIQNKRVPAELMMEITAATYRYSVLSLNETATDETSAAMTPGTIAP
ncbi:MAG: type 4a pilus biogenesis protein PilO [Gammaproteobacteria bacterium]